MDLTKLDKILNRSDICSLFQELVLHDRFKNITIPQRFSKNIFIKNNLAFLIVLDSVIKFQIIIEDDLYLSNYLEQLRRLLKKFTTYQDLENAVNTIIGKLCAIKLGLSNTHNKDNKDKILRYIYDKYIINGYFYYGFSSSYKNELEYIGIRKDGLIVDNKIKTINNILNQYNLDCLYKEEKANISDNLIVAAYHSFMAPIYLEQFSKSKILINDNYDNKVLYTKDIKGIKEMLIKIATNNRFNEQDKTNFINTFLDIIDEDKINTSKPQIAFIKRKSINKNHLKDFELIINNAKDISLASSISLITESRYESYELYEDIPNISINIIELPTYQEITLGNYRYIEIEEEKEYIKISDLKEKNIEHKNDYKEKLTTRYLQENSYGVATIAILGLLFIAIGLIFSIIIKIY